MAIYICLVICFTAIVINGNAQGTVNLQKTVVIPANAIQLDSLLRLINKQAGVKFSINTRKLPAGKYIRIKEHKQSVAALLRELKQSTGIYYAVLGDHIILLDNPPAAKRKPANAVHTVQAPRSAVKSRVPQMATVPANKSSVVHHKPPVASQPLSPLKKIPPTIDTPAFSPAQPRPIIDAASHKNPGHDSSKAIVITPVKKQPSKARPTGSNQSTPQAASTEKHSFTNNLLIKSGVSADDIFYFNPTVQVGSPYVYGIASWSSNFNVSGFRYGVGGAVPLNDQWKLHLQLSTGNLSSTFDTSGKRWEFKTRLHRAACVAEVNLTPRLSIQFGPVFNYTKLIFYRDGEKMAPGLPADQVDKKFNLLKPVYTLSDNFSLNKAQSTKTWIGFQAGIFYDLNFFRRE